MKTGVAVAFLALSFLSLNARAEMGDCWGGTAPTSEQYFAKLKTGDACEVQRVPMACELKVIKAALKRQAKGFTLSSVAIDSDSPLNTIDLEFMNSKYSTKGGTVKVEYDKNHLGECKIISIKIDSTSCPDVGC